jgi:hypothetical protein
MGDGFCAYNCLSIACHMTDQFAQQIMNNFQMYLLQDQFPHMDIVYRIDEITGRRQRAQMEGEISAIESYRADAATSEIEIHLVLLLAYMLDVALVLIAPAENLDNMADHDYEFQANKTGFWFMDSKQSGKTPIYMSFEPFTNTKNNAMHYNLLVQAPHSYDNPMSKMAFIERILAGREECQQFYAARPPPAPPPALALLPPPLPEAHQVALSLEPAPQAPAAAAPAKKILKRRAPRPHKPHGWKKWFDKKTEDEKVAYRVMKADYSRTFMANKRLKESEEKKAKLIASGGAAASEGNT